MLNHILTIGDKIELRKFSNRRESNCPVKAYVSQLLEIMPEHTAKIAMPIESNKIILLEIGAKYDLCFFTKKGLYQCRCIIINRYKTQKIYIAAIKFITDLEKNQRRQYFRLECVTDIQYRVIPESEHKLWEKISKAHDGRAEINLREEIKKIQNTWERGVVIDVSGGGIRFNSSISHEKGTQILLRMPLELKKGMHIFELKGIIITSNHVLNREVIYEHRMEFVDISKDDKEEIVKYIFTEERKRLRKEKGL